MCDRGGLASRTNSSGTYEYLYDLGGKLVSTRTSAGAVVQPEIYIGGRHWGSIIANSTVFMHTDWLGTGRVWTSLSGGTYKACQSLPFGDGQSCQLSNPATEFAGLLFDPSTNLWNAQFRNQSPTQGHWMSPDPAGLAAVDPSSPQSWNRYAYVANNPVSFTDPTGLKLCDGCHFLGAGAGGGCTLDGVDASCSTVAFLLQTGGADSITITSVGGQQVTYSIGSTGFGQAKIWIPGGCVTTSGGGGPDTTSCVAGGAVSIVDLFGAGSAGGGDMSVGMDIWHCPGCAATWRNASGTVNRLAGATAVLAAPVVVAGAGPVIVAASGAIDAGGVAGAATAEAYGIPATAMEAWTITNWRTVTSAGRWLYNQYQCQVQGNC